MGCCQSGSASPSQSASRAESSTAAAGAPADGAAPAAEDLRASLDFDDTMASREGRQKMLAFAKREHSEENMLFFIDIQKYKTASEDARSEVGEEIVQTYLAKSAKVPLNLPSNVMVRFVGDPIKGERTGNYTYSADLFDPAESEIRLLLLKDTFTRFKRSEEASQLLKEMANQSASNT